MSKQAEESTGSGNIPRWRRWLLISVLFGGGIVPAVATVTELTSGNARDPLTYVVLAVLMPGALPGSGLGWVVSATLSSLGIELGSGGGSVLSLLLAASLNACFYGVLAKWLWLGIREGRKIPSCLRCSLLPFVCSRAG